MSSRISGSSHIEVGRMQLCVRGLSAQTVQAALAGLGEALLRELAAQEPPDRVGRRAIERLELELGPEAAANAPALRQALVAALAQAIGGTVDGAVAPGNAAMGSGAAGAAAPGRPPATTEVTG
jgi:hypothetical protein